RLMYPIVNEAARCLAEGIVTDAQDVDIGMIFGTGFAPFRGGPLRWAEQVGAKKMVETLEQLSGKVGARFAPSEPLVEMARNGKTSPLIESVAPVLQTEVILRSGKKVNGSIFKGVDPVQLNWVRSKVAEWSVKDPLELADQQGSGHVFLGSEMAYDMGVIPG